MLISAPVHPGAGISGAHRPGRPVRTGPVDPGTTLVATPPAPGADHPAIAPLLSEFADVFQDPTFPPADRVTHDISLLDPSDQPPKPKQYRLSPAE